LKSLQEVMRVKGILCKKQAIAERLQDIDIEKLAVEDGSFRKLIRLITEWVKEVGGGPIRLVPDAAIAARDMFLKRQEVHLTGYR
ncbi:MAG: hypothetical protein K6U78_16260, partial [Anaerolineae bacterium]|nr:hypothetical protein [Anaerolineae bacterium]